MTVKRRLLYALLALLMVSGCAAPASKTEALPPAPSAAPTEKGSVRIEGEGAADTKATAAVEGVDLRFSVIRWFLDEKELMSKGKDLVIPASGAGKSLVCRVTDPSGTALAESEPVTVLSRAGGAVFTMAGLREDVKWLGRTEPHGTGLTADWSGSGFEMRLRSAGNGCRVAYNAEKSAYFVLFVDGERIDRPLLDGKGELEIPLSAGEHTLSLVRDTEVQASGGVVLQAFETDGEILPRPADKSVFIQVIGDSIACGDGALGAYVPGEVWKLSDHAATSGYPYLLSRLSDVDVEIVAKGGIGLIKKAGNYQMREMYEYINRYRDQNKADFLSARVPDVIVLELGTNDSVSTCNEEQFYQALAAFVKKLREKWGDAPAIVWMGKASHRFESALRYQKSAGDARFYVFTTEFGGSGSAALATQSHGHPSAAEQMELAQGLAGFLTENGLI